MKKSNSILAMATIIALMLGGCASTGVTTSGHLTNVELSSPNFRIVATNVSGEASNKGVFGVSYGFGMAASQLALIPLGNDRLLYKNAMKQLWDNFEAANGPVTNRKLALVNVRYDSESLNVFFYTKVTAVVVADVVEFQ
ncbi:MAG: hypothetical protein RIG68_20815 [Imperialibacter sp.]|uniref:DUF6567 family protein n=1 Tax=Imperialibacter sp. TaxID=2038411 RepID=UPI0032EF1793